MGVLVGIIESLMLVPVEGWSFGADRRRDRRLLRDGRVRCGIRAVKRRVLDIGTEWSVGTCAISTGRLRFTPRVGVVGDRHIEVLEVLSCDVDLDANLDRGFGQIATYVIRTAKGDLLWALPDSVSDEASALLFAE